LAEIPNDDRAQARREAAQLLGVDVEHLSPADNLRVDMVSSLRLVVDAEQANILSGNSADVARLNVAVASLIALLPGKALPEPKPADGGPSDPRVHMWNTYLEARRRGEIAKAESTYEGALREVERLRAELAALKAAGVPAPGESTAPPLPDNVVKLSTRVDNPSPPAAPPKPAPQPQAAPTYDYNTDQSWRSHVLPDGTIIPTPFGGGSKYWGPV
jgi:hypothetical protein